MDVIPEHNGLFITCEEQNGSDTNGTYPSPETPTPLPSCGPCNFDGEQVPADGGYCKTCQDYMCKSCFSQHHKTRATRYHQLIKGCEMNPGAWLCFDEICSRTCDHHSDKPIEYYCRSHDELGCHDCTNEKHHSCNISFIPEVSQGFREAHEFKTFSQTIEELDEDAKELEEIIQHNRKRMDDVNNMAIESIRRFKSDMIVYLEMREAELLALTRERKVNDDALLDDLLAECHRIQDDLRDIKSLLEKYSKNGKQQGALYIATKRAMLPCVRLKVELFTLTQRDKPSAYYFEPSGHVREALVSLGSLVIGKADGHRGSVHGLGTIRSRKKGKSLVDMRLVRTGQVYVKSNNDRRMPLIKGMVQIDDDTLVLTDYNNVALKVVDMKRNVLTTFPLSSRPCDVTSVNSHQIAITMPECKAVTIVSTGNGSDLSDMRSFKVNGSCYGICCHDNTFIVTFRYPAKVEILSIFGEVLTRIASTSGVLGHVTMVTSGCDEHVMVTGWTSNLLMKVNKEKGQLKEYTVDGLPCPTGVVNFGEGRFAVCNQSDASICVVEDDGLDNITAIGAWDCIDYPTAVLFSAQHDALYVSSGLTWEPDFADYIHVYSLV